MPKRRRGDGRAKTESLSLRFDPKLKFMAEFVARATDRKMTTVIERALRSVANETFIEGPDGQSLTWRDFWDEHPGVREIKLLMIGELELTMEEEEVRAFVLAHQPIFCEPKPVLPAATVPLSTVTSQRTVVPTAQTRSWVFHKERIQVLWAKFDEYVQVWMDTRAIDPYNAGNLMKQQLHDAGVWDIEWPPGTGSDPSPEEVGERKKRRRA